MMRVTEPDVPPSIPNRPVARMVGHDGPITSVCFTDDGRYCFTGGHDRTVRLWNPARFDPAFPPPSATTAVGAAAATDVPAQSLPRALPIHTYGDGIAHPVSSISVASQGSSSSSSSSMVLAAASDRTVVIVDVVTGRVKCRFQGHEGRVNAVSWSRGGDTVMSASYDATVRIWDGRSCRSHSPPVQTLRDAADSVTDVHAAQDDGDDDVPVQTPGGGGTPRRHRRRGRPSSSSSSTKALIRTCSVDGALRTYDIRMGMLRRDGSDDGVPITGMRPTSDDRFVALNCLDGTIRLADVDAGTISRIFRGHHVAGRYGIGCAFNADDTAVITGSEDGSAVMYRVGDAYHGNDGDDDDGGAATAASTATPPSVVMQKLEGHTQPTCSVAAHPDVENNSVVVTASYDGSAVLWGSDPDYIKWVD